MLGVSSDQAVLDLLERLSAKGLITREPGKARGIRLTREGYVAIGVPPASVPDEITPFGPMPDAAHLSATQQRLSELLLTEDPKLAAMYTGALRVLRDDGNPERVAQSAHSIREITYHFSNKAKGFVGREEALISKQQKDSNARQLERLFDPRGGTKRITHTTVYDEWNKLHRFFVEVSHHQREMPAHDYVPKLEHLEGFLINYILPPQPEFYLQLDQQIDHGPNECDPEHLRRLLTRNLESFRYFLRKADARWLPYLREHSFLTPWQEMGAYMSRIAPQSPDLVMEIILSTSAEDIWVRTSFIEAATAMPVGVGRRLVAKVRSENWFQDPNLEFLAGVVGDYCKKLIESAAYDEACDVAKEVLAVRKKDDILRGRGGSYYYQYAEFLKVLSGVPPAHSQPFIRLLVEVLGRAILLEADGKNQDRSHHWRPAIEEDDQNWSIGDIRDALVSTLRDLIERFIVQMEPQSSLCSALDELLAHDPSYSIFKRLKLYFYRIHPEHASQAIARALFRYVDDIALWHEYAMLLRDAFPSLSDSVRNGYLALLDAGPCGEHAEDYVQDWRLRKLGLIKAHLTLEESEGYASLLAAYPMPEHPEFHIYLSPWTSIGPTSPADQQTLAALTTEELIRYLVGWNPAGQFFGSSREGLGRELSTVIKNDAERFSRDARLFVDTRLNTIYLYCFFSGILAASREGRQLDWAPVLDLAEAIVQRWPTEQRREENAGDLENEGSWAGVFQELAYVLDNALNRPDGGLQFAERPRVWKVIERCCECADPSLTAEEQFGENGLGPAHIAINSARGVGFHALFAYIFWCDRHRDPKADKDVSRIPGEAKAVLKKHLDPNHDASLSVRFVYGQFFPWLYLYDREWAEELIDDLFPREHVNRRYAAWEAYLSRNLFEDVFHALRSKYELAIDDLKPSIPARRYWLDPVSGLGQHMVVAYAFGTDTSGYLCRRFFREADAKQRGAAVSFGGRVYVHRKPRPGELSPDEDRLKTFWEWRLAESDDAEELAHFGWWVRPGRFDDGWQLDLLKRTLEKTKGIIEPDYEVLKAINVMAPEWPVQVAHVLDLLIRAGGAQGSILWHTSELQDVLSKVYQTKDPVASCQADAITDYLTRLGFESYRYLHSKGGSAGGVEYGKGPAPC